tara:strand:- start:1260 stop:3278 length:2019 start_codon:yes stop_codon:yes gene_type:complete
MSKFYNLLIKDRIFIFSSLALLIPLILFSVNDYEEYDQGIYSARYMYSDILNFFSNFNIKLGMGSTFPIGQGLFFYPTSFFSFNLKLFITTTVILNSLIQYSYFKKICIKILKIKNNNFFKIVSVLLIISLPNLSYNYIDDWISMYTSYTILFPLIYYTIKYQKFYKANSIIKLCLFTTLFILNGHLGYSLQVIIILISFFILNKTNILLYKKIFFIISILFIAVCFDKFYQILLTYKSYPSVINNVGNFLPIDINHILKIILLPFNYILRIIDFIFNTKLSFTKDLLNGREVGYGIQIILGLFLSIFSFSKKLSKKIYYLDYIYLILVVVLIMNNYFNVSNYLNYIRDSINLFSLILIIYFLTSFKYSKICSCVILFLLFTNLLLYVESVRHLKNQNINILEDNLDLKQNQIINKIPLSSLKTSDFSRIYLSKGVYEDINDKRNLYFKQNKIFSPKDLTHHGLNVFNVDTKNASYIALRDGDIKMHNNISPKNSEIENKFLMNLYSIKFIFIYDKEFKKLKNSELKKVHEFDLNNKKLLIIKNLDFGKQIILEDINFNNTCNSNNKLDCLLKIKDIFTTNNNIIVKDNNYHKIQIENNNSKKVILLLPFLQINNWKLKIKSKKIFNYFNLVELKPREKLEINLINLKHVIIKIISIFSFMILVFLSFKIKN